MMSQIGWRTRRDKGGIVGGLTYSLQLTVLSVTAAAGHPPRQLAPAGEAKRYVDPIFAETR